MSIIIGDSKVPSSHLSDSGNAQRFVQQHRDKVKYCGGIGWLIYDGKRWCKADEKIDSLAKQTALSIYREAADHKDTEKRKAIAAWALRSEGLGRIRSMVSLARCEVPVSVDELDSDPWILNCLNGTLSLRTGELQGHNPKDLITKLAPISYDPSAYSTLWERVLTHAIPSDELRHFFQKLVGYTLTGNAGEDVFVLIYGPTRTSKGTIQEAIASMLGDYAITSELDVLAERDRTGGPRPELTRLRGARMVSIYETSRRMRLSASLVKTLAGSDPITARTLHKEPITFKPTAKIWVATNYLPQVPADDDALWERIRQIPFDVQLSESERDRTVRSSLQEPEHAMAILEWSVQGCLNWQRDGLKQPREVREAGQAYRTLMDPAQRFIAECCILGTNTWCSTSELRSEYETWCKEQGETAISADSFTRKLRELGCTPKKNNRKGGRGWAGIAIQGSIHAVEGVQ